MLTASELKTLLRTHGLRLTKRLGQHHLIDRQMIGRIVEGCGVSSGDTVVEIGAGLGALTELLAERTRRVIAVEVDRRICALLAERMRPWKNVEVVCGDILEFSWEQASGAVVVGAIPYHITSPILVSLCEARQLIQKAVLILQAEVADRLLAQPGTKAYGRLSVLGQYCWDITAVLTVPRSGFFPQPEVDSRCLRLLPQPHSFVRVGDEAVFFEVVKRAFAHRRKTLVNCLSEAARTSTEPSSSKILFCVSRAEAETMVTALGLPASVRGEMLSLAQFAALADLLKK